MNLRDSYIAIREHSVNFSIPLQKEDFVIQLAEFTSPILWHLAHTTWFFEEMILKEYSKNYKEFNPQFGFLFNSYYESIGNRQARGLRGALTRPGVDQVLAYRRYVDEHILNILEDQRVSSLLTLGLQHEQQHQELMITDLKFSFSFNPIYPVYSEHFLKGKSEEDLQEWISIPEGLYMIGHKDEGFCFDNELGLHKQSLEAYKISNRLVTNGEYIDFIEDAAYQNSQLWHSEGWTYAQENPSPLYWFKKNKIWYHYTLRGIEKVPIDHPVNHVNFYEASAYANWRGMRLPTEFEWEVASEKLNWGSRWEWTNSAYLPYPRFKIAEGAVGEYNGKFMVNQMVLRGGSVATSPNHSRKTYRNFFHPKHNWQFSGIRLIK